MVTESKHSSDVIQPPQVRGGVASSEVIAIQSAARTLAENLRTLICFVYVTAYFLPLP